VYETVSRERRFLIMKNYKGYIIKATKEDYFKYTVTGCVWNFKTAQNVKDYIDDHELDKKPSIAPSPSGSMIYYHPIGD